MGIGSGSKNGPFLDFTIFFERKRTFLNENIKKTRK